MKMMFYFLFFTPFSFQFSIRPSYNDKTKKMYVKCNLGTPDQNNYFNIDISIDKSLVLINENYNYNLSTTFKNTKVFLYYTAGVQGYYCNDYLKISNGTSLRLFYFVLSEGTPLDTENIFSLGMGPMSFISQLYYDGIITNQTFSIGNDIEFGVSYDRNEKLKVFGEDETKYIVNVSNIFTLYDNNILNIYEGNKNLKMIFSTSEDYLIFPIAFFKKFSKAYLKASLKDSNCVILTKHTDKKIQCSKEGISNFNNLFFTLNDHYITEFDYMDMFEEVVPYSKMYQLKIEFREGIKDLIFGYKFIRAMGTVFNQEEKYIFFKDKKKFYLKGRNPYLGNKRRILKVVLICIIVVVLVGFIINGLYIISKREKLER